MLRMLLDVTFVLHIDALNVNACQLDVTVNIILQDRNQLVAFAQLTA